MLSTKKLKLTALFTGFILSLLLFAAVDPCRAQTSVTSSDNAYPFSADSLKPWVVSDSAAPSPVAPDSATPDSATPDSATPYSVSAEQPTSGDPAGAPLPQASKTGADDAWHFAVSPYLWFPGVHGVASGPNDNGLGFSASPGDLLSHFRFGLMGAVEARHKRFITSIDMMWIRLGDDNAVPFPALSETTANIHMTEFLLTPKVGYRLIDAEKIKIDATAGLRYWHLSESLNFEPSVLGLNFSSTQNFVDPLVGGRIQVPLSPKIAITIVGDVGGWNTGSKLEYQVGGVIGYRIKPAVSLEAGYRYLNLDYATSRNGVFNITTAGVIFGVTINLK
jgi:hypothetical protein